MNLAARGARQMGDEMEKIEDQDELDQVRRQAGRVTGKSALVAAALTLAALLL